MSQLASLCYPSFAFLNNRLDQNPCQVAQRLVDICEDVDDDGYYSIQPLDLQHGQRQYRAPFIYQNSPCICSMGVYNLVQGCAACQQGKEYNSTLWTDWVSNCTMSNINGGQTFPYEIPSDTALPDWACINNANGALSVGGVFRRITGINKTWPDISSLLSSSSSASSTTISSSSTTTYTEVGAAQTVSKVDADPKGDGATASSATTKIVAVVVPLVLVGAVFGAFFAYLRKKRKLKRRGHRLDSSTDLPAGGVRSQASNSGTAVDYAGGTLMAQKNSRVSLFVPSESVFTRGSRRSFATNSVSTGEQGAFFNPNRASTAYTPSSGFDTISRSTEYTYDESYTDYDREDEEEDEHERDRDGPDDDDSISPFSDIHRPQPSVLNTRNNIHSPAFSRRSRSVTTFGSIHLSDASSQHGSDAQSLLTVDSRGAPPSSSGATYGGVHDEDDEEGSDLDDRSLRSRR
ncbi:hypothetical protein JCM8097_007713 [Rhodosporidiobolus ruineniae]